MSFLFVVVVFVGCIVLLCDGHVFLIRIFMMLSWEILLKHADCMGMLKVKYRETGFVHSAREFYKEWL